MASVGFGDLEEYEKIQMTYKAFENAKTFEDIIQCYMQYYEGKIPWIPGYYGALCPDTLRQLTLLKKVNQLGYLTTDSQDGLAETVDGFVKTTQRAYIKGFIPKSLWDRISFQLTFKNILAVVNPIKDSELVGRIPVTYQSSSNDFPTGLWLSECGSNEYEEILEHIHPDHSFNSEDYYFLLMCDLTWGHSGRLMNTVYNALRASQ